MAAVPDDELLSATRSLDDEAFAELWRRHSPAAAAAARAMAPASDVDDIVSESFLRILTAIRDGAGPQSVFRPYLYQVIRSVVATRYRSAEQTTDELDALPDPGSFDDPLVKDFDDSAVSAAYNSLPERWRAVLWYTEVEGMPPRKVAPLVGLTAASVAALAFRAREGLRSAWVEAHANQAKAEGECSEILPQLQRYQRGKLPARATRVVEDHLERCSSCASTAAEFSQLNSQLALGIAGAVIGLALATKLLPIFSIGTKTAVAVTATSAAAAANAGAGASGAAGGSASGGAGGAAGGAGAGAAAGGAAGGGLGIAAVSGLVAAGVLVVAGAGVAIAAGVGAFAPSEQTAVEAVADAADDTNEADADSQDAQPPRKQSDTETKRQPDSVAQADAAPIRAPFETPPARGGSATPALPTSPGGTPGTGGDPGTGGPGTGGPGTGGPGTGGPGTGEPGTETPPPALDDVTLTGDWALGGPLGLRGTGALPLATIEVRAITEPWAGAPITERRMTTQAGLTGAWQLDEVTGVTPLGVTIEVRQRVGLLASPWFATPIADAYFGLGVSVGEADDDGSGLGWSFTGWPGAEWAMLPLDPADPEFRGTIGADGRVRVVVPAGLAPGEHEYRVGYEADGGLAESPIRLTVTVPAPTPI